MRGAKERFKKEIDQLPLPYRKDVAGLLEMAASGQKERELMNKFTAAHQAGQMPVPRKRVSSEQFTHMLLCRLGQKLRRERG